MRILSQQRLNLDYDIPYEQVCLNISKKSESSFRICAWHSLSDSDDNCHLMAEYSTKSKARKAMEMLREEYAGMPSIRRMDDLYGRFKHTGKKDFELFIEHMVLMKYYFRFPADDEVEV